MSVSECVCVCMCGHVCLCMSVQEYIIILFTACFYHLLCVYQLNISIEIYNDF